MTTWRCLRSSARAEAVQADRVEALGDHLQGAAILRAALVPANAGLVDPAVDREVLEVRAVPGVSARRPSR